MILTFASSKGGAGKSTCCASLALAGDTVLIMELDPRAHLSRLAEKLALTTLTVQPIEQATFTDTLSKTVESRAFDHILIDVAGQLDVTMFLAMARSNLVIIPLKPGEMELHEALVVIKSLKEMSKTFGRDVPYTLLMTDIHPLGSSMQSFVFGEVKRLGLPRLDTAFVSRVSYKEQFFNGQPPAVREPDKGAGPEIAAAIREIRALADASAAARPKPRAKAGAAA